MAVQFSDPSQKRFETFLTRYPTKRAALLPTFWLAQKEFGYLSPQVLEYIAQLLELSPTDVGSVASFYTMLYTKPMGKFHVQVCTNLSCTLLGAGDLVECLARRLGIEPGSTTDDRQFSLSEVECLGACGTAPVVQINDDYHEKLSPDGIRRIIDALAD